MDVLEAIRNRRSHRAFTAEPVEPEKVEAILEAGRWAPSAANSQPWEFILITSAAARRRIYELSEEAKRTGHVAIRGFSYVRPLPGEVTGEDETLAAVQNYSFKFLKNVPVIIAVVGMPATPVQQASPGETADSYKYACGAVIQNMLLAAESMELGSLWFTFFDPQLAGQFLGIGPDRRLVALVLVGYPAGNPLPPARLPLDAKVRRII